MNFDFSNWILGIFTAIAVGVIGRLVYKVISDSLEKKPKLDWFVLADFSSPELSIHDASFDLFYAAKQQDAEKFTEEVIDSYRDDLRSTQKAVKIKIRNSGKGTSETISILLEREPYFVSLEPAVTTRTSKTADKKLELEIGAIGKDSSLSIFLYGVSRYEIAGVFHKGITVEKNSWANLVPYKEPRNHWLWAIWGVLLGTWVVNGIDYLAEKQTTNSELQPELGVPSENEGEPSQ